MARGRPPKPTAQKKLAGNAGKRKLNNDEPSYDTITSVDAPEYLDELATTAWNTYAPLLCGQSVLCVTDLHNLEIFCMAYSGWRRSHREAATEITLMQDNGTVKKHPALGAANEFANQMRTFGALLGLSPADRSKIMSPKAKEDDNPFSKLIDMMKA
ncbi:MAG: phage terminase small subunit P27 family [Bermanella sp.]